MYERGWEGVYDHKTGVEKALYIKGVRHSGRIFDTVLIPNRIIKNGRNIKVPAVVFVYQCRFGGTQFFISVHTFFSKICYNIKKSKNFQKSLHTFKNIGTTIYEGPFKYAREEASYGTSGKTNGENTYGR